MDPKGIILKANKALVRFTGTDSEDDLAGRGLISFIPEEFEDSYRDQLEPFLSNRKKNLVVNLGFWKFVLDKVVVGNTFLIVGILIDITEEIESQQAAEKSEASKSIFLANMSHEIRTPIHTVTGLAELLNDTELDSEQGEYVSQIEFAAKVLLTLINDILDFSKIEAGKLTFENIEYNLYETIHNSVDLSALEAHKKGVDVGISIDDQMPMTIIGDQVRLRQIIVNLMSNAVKFTQKGEIILEIKSREENGQIFIRFSVTDSGIGISKEKQQHLFKAFSQADTSTTRQFGGTGLGLSISSSLVQLMGGEMQVDSEEGRGASFFFEIPVTKGIDILPTFKKAPQENLKILVIDDNKTVNRIFSDQLRSWGYEVNEVYNGMDGINELIIKATTGQPYDICFIDQILPGMDGWQLAGEINSNSLINGTKRVLMSLKGKGIEESKMKLLGWFEAYLTKPVSKEELYRAITDIYTKPELEELEELDELEELEDLDELEDDDEFMEPIKFSDHVYDVVEELDAVDDNVYTSAEEELTNNILIVEDHLVNQKLFKTILEKSGYSVFVASDGKEALDVVESEKLDLIFMDCQMPVMNGYDSSTEIRNLGYEIPIVAVTASAVKGEYDKCINAGMSDVMTKPFKKDDVLKSLDKWLNREDIVLFDYEKALERFMGEKEILVEVLPPYIENLENCLEELKGLNTDSDFVRIRELAHSIKGSSLNLDIVALGKEAEILEDLAYNERKEGLKEGITKIDELATQTKAELQSYIG